MDPKGMFKIGQRNHTVLKKLLWKNNMMVDGESIGESLSRTMILDIKTGVTKIKSMGKIFEIQLFLFLPSAKVPAKKSLNN